MSVQFGRWSFEAQPAGRGLLAEVEPLLVPYGPDGGNSYSTPGIDVLYRAFHTTKESRCETQPHLCSNGTVIVWDGRLDNRDDLVRSFGDAAPRTAADTAIVALAWERSGTDCLAELNGDWALSVWNPNDRSLVFAKDALGTRHLYYSLGRNQVVWSTILDPLMMLGGRTLPLEEEYIAGWFSCLPALHLTPYVGIESVPPGSFVRIRPGSRSVTKYWDFDPARRIRYPSDHEYEEHFRDAFAQSVRRRLRSDSPMLAELSGGMDSSSIVCMADSLIARGEAETSDLRTLSYYDDREPNWNERPYFTRVEAVRGRVGVHIDVGADQWILWRPDTSSLARTPTSAGRPTQAATKALDHMVSQRHRVLLSGIGGDEVAGGVPTPAPELADLLARAEFKTLAHRLKVWAVEKRSPWFYLLFEALRGFTPRFPIGTSNHRRCAGWLDSAFARRHAAALARYESRMELFGPLPSFQQNLKTLDGLRRQLACSTLQPGWPYEKRYPFLDRDLLEFLYAIPREQLVRPGQRRSLMRRALSGIVPNQILDRKRKAFVARAPRAAISVEWTSLVEMSRNMVSCSLGVVDAEAFRQALESARDGGEALIVPLFRTVAVEMWLRNLAHWNLLPRQAAAQVTPKPDACEQKSQLGRIGRSLS